MRGLARVWLRAMTHVNTRIESHVLPQMSHVFAESDYTRALLSNTVPEQRLSLGVPGVDTDVFHPADAYNFDGHILAVGRLADPRKNVRMLLTAYRELRLALPTAPRLVLAGSSRPQPEDWALANEWGISDYIDVQENVTVKMLADLYRRASLFVLSSDEEGLGIVILEAMASGIPVVSTDCGGPATAVVESETGCLTTPGDAIGLAKTMQLLLEQPSLRYEMGQKARTIAQARFSLKAAGAMYLEKYDELLDLRG
jgi:glycosyltransferase involved in cell wall biosynthesis